MFLFVLCNRSSSCFCFHKNNFICQLIPIINVILCPLFPWSKKASWKKTLRNFHQKTFQITHKNINQSLCDILRITNLIGQISRDMKRYQGCENMGLYISEWYNKVDWEESSLSDCGKIWNIFCSAKVPYIYGCLFHFYFKFTLFNIFIQIVKVGC